MTSGRKYAGWTSDDLREEIIALVQTVERLEAERDEQRKVARYLRACAHLFPHINTDRETCEEIGLPDAADVWCLACTVGSELDEFDRELLQGDDEHVHDERARQWMTEYEVAQAERYEAETPDG